MYTALVTAEALGTSGKARVTDLGLNNNNPYSPAYAVYEDGVPQRVILINHLTDPNGGANYTANIAIGGGNTGQAIAIPTSVTVKQVVHIFNAHILMPNTADIYSLLLLLISGISLGRAK
jgi:hypothetical protein